MRLSLRTSRCLQMENIGDYSDMFEVPVGMKVYLCFKLYSTFNPVRVFCPARSLMNEPTLQFESKLKSTHTTFDNKTSSPQQADADIARQLKLCLMLCVCTLFLQLYAYTAVCDCATNPTMVCNQCLDRGALTVRLLSNGHVYSLELSASGA